MAVNEMAETVCWLSSDRAKYASGAAFTVDGASGGLCGSADPSLTISFSLLVLLTPPRGHVVSALCRLRRQRDDAPTDDTGSRYS